MLLRGLLIWRLRRALVGGLGGLGHRVLCRTLRGVTLRAVVELAVVELVVALLTLGRGGALALLLIRIGCWRTLAATAAALHRRTLLHVRLLRMLRALLALGVLSLRRLILRGLIRIPTLRALALLRGRTVALRGTLLIRRGRHRPPLLLRRELLALRRALLLGLLLRLRGTLILVLVLTLVLRRSLLLILLTRGLLIGSLIGRLIGRRRGLLILLLGCALRRAIHGRLRSRRLLLGSGRRGTWGGRRGHGRAGAGARGARRWFLGGWRGGGRGGFGGSARGLLGSFVDRRRARDARRPLRRLAGWLAPGTLAGAGLGRAGTVGGGALVTLAAGTGSHRKGESCWVGPGK